MSRIWLRCLLVDPRTKKVLATSDDEPLPERLELRHLRSFLERRFGRPLATGRGATRGLCFRPPKEAGHDGAHLIAMPMMRERESAELFSVYGRLSQVASLAGSLDEGWASDVVGLERREPWFGPMIDPVHLRQTVNDLAARAVRAWVIAEGLAAEVEAIRAAQADAPPAPGLARSREQARLAARRAAAAADPAWDLSGTVVRCTAGVLDGAEGGDFQELQQAEELLGAAFVETRAQAEETDRATRAVAQVGLGVSALLGGSARVEQLDRTCVAVLQPPGGHGDRVALLQDGVVLSSESRDELLVEIAAIVCRILVERATEVRLEAPGPAGGWFQLGVGRDDVLVTTAAAASSDQGVGGRSGRAARRKGKPPVTRTWPSPVSVLVPARLAVDTLFGEFGLERPGAIVVTVSPAADGGTAPAEPPPAGRRSWVM